MIPRLISGWPNSADSAAILKSQAIANSQPPPNASALTAAIVAMLELSMALSTACISSTNASPAGGSIVVKALMSAPAQNSIGFAEANTSARTVPEPDTSSHSFVSVRATSGEIEFAGGRSSQAIATAPRVSSLTGLSSQPESGRAYG